jgi:hypothetical protein
MKTLTFLALSLTIISNLSADTGSDLLAKCLKPAKKYYAQNAGPSDVARKFLPLQILIAGNSLSYGQKEVGHFADDKLIYQGTGSYYSGYFIDYVVVDPTTCQVEQILNVYSE